MKKLIAISVVFALLTGAAFAQVSIGVEAWAGAVLVWGETNAVYGYENDMEAQESKARFLSGGGEEAAYRPSKIEGPLASAGTLDGADEDGAWNAVLKFSYETDGGEAGVSFNLSYKDEWDAMNAWWYLVPQLKLGFGESADLGRGDATPFHYEEGSGNWFAVSIIPMDMFALNISFLDKSGNHAFDKTRQTRRATTTAATPAGYGWIDDDDDPATDPIWGPIAAGTSSTTYSYAGGDAYTGDAGYMYADVFVIQAVVNIPGDLGQLSFTYDNQYYNEDGFAKSGPDFRGMGFFLDYGVADLMGFGVSLDFGFHYLSGSKKYNPLSPWYDQAEMEKLIHDPIKVDNPNWRYDQLTGDKYSKWGVGFKAGYNIMGIDLGMSFGMSQETIDVALRSDDNAGSQPKMFGMVMDLGFSVGYTLDLGMFDLALKASLDMLNLTGTDYYNTKASDTDAEERKEAQDRKYANYVKGYMGLEYEFDISLIKNIGGFTFTGGLNIFGDNIEREAHYSDQPTAAQRAEGARTKYNDSHLRYKVPILFSYSW